MEIDVVSDLEFRDLKDKVEALVVYLNLEGHYCKNEAHRNYGGYSCPDCQGFGYIFKPKTSDQKPNLE